MCEHGVCDIDVPLLLQICLIVRWVLAARRGQHPRHDLAALILVLRIDGKRVRIAVPRAEVRIVAGSIVVRNGDGKEIRVPAPTREIHGIPIRSLFRDIGRHREMHLHRCALCRCVDVHRVAPLLLCHDEEAVLIAAGCADHIRGDPLLLECLFVGAEILRLHLRCCALFRRLRLRALGVVCRSLRLRGRCYSHDGIRCRQHGRVAHAIPRPPTDANTDQ